MAQEKSLEVCIWEPMEYSVQLKLRKRREISQGVTFIGEHPY